MTQMDRDEMARAWSRHTRNQAKQYMPAPVEIQVFDGTQHLSTGFAWGKLAGRTVRVRVPAFIDLSGASVSAPVHLLAQPINQDEPGAAMYQAVDVAWNGQNGSRRIGLSSSQNSTANVSNPPTDAELDTAFGSPAAVGAGWMTVLDDNGGDANVYLVASNGTSWWYVALTKAT